MSSIFDKNSQRIYGILFDEQKGAAVKLHLSSYSINPPPTTVSPS
jgi:hypothetical protein